MIAKEARLLTNNLIRMTRKKLILKNGKAYANCAYKGGKKCRPGKCRYNKEYACDDVTLSATDLACISIAYDFAARGIALRKSHGKPRGRMLMKAYRMKHIALSGYCLRCGVGADELCSIGSGQKSWMHAKCIHPYMKEAVTLWRTTTPAPNVGLT